MKKKITKKIIRTKYTTIKEIEETYGVDLGVRSDMKLSTFLERKGYKSLAKILKSM